MGTAKVGENEMRIEDNQDRAYLIVGFIIGLVIGLIIGWFIF